MKHRQRQRCTTLFQVKGAQRHKQRRLAHNRDKASTADHRIGAVLNAAPLPAWRAHQLQLLRNALQPHKQQRLAHINNKQSISSRTLASVRISCSLSASFAATRAANSAARGARAGSSSLRRATSKQRVCIDFVLVLYWFCTGFVFCL